MPSSPVERADSQITKIEGMTSLSITVFVVNDMLWEIMRHKRLHPDRMLPMVTFPWFYCDVAETGSEGAVVRRDMDCPLLSLDEAGGLVIRGRGGNFCGLVEARVLEQKGRPIILPAAPGNRDPVPNYQLADICLILRPGRRNVTLYPEPDKRFDYRFSESPKVYYKYGLRVTTDGSYVLLSTDRATTRQLRGEVTVLFGMVPDGPDESPVHSWLRSLEKHLLG